MSFRQNLETGRIAEGMIASWLRNRGASVMPAYEKEIPSGKGPQLFTPDDEIVLPDLFVFAHNGTHWIECKHKSVFSWHYKTQKWTTGIDNRHYHEYLKVEKITQSQVWLLFYHSDSKPAPRDIDRGCPPECPTGLFGEELCVLSSNINHTSPPFDAGRHGIIRHGNSGMVYWSHDVLKQIASKEEVIEAKNILSGKIAA